MNVCMVAHAVYECDSRLMCYAETLAKAGHNVDAVVLSGSEGTPCDVVNGVKLFRVFSRSEGARTRFTYVKSVLGFFIRATILMTSRDLQKHYDVIHVHSVPDFLVFAALVPKLRGSKVILDIHDVLPEFYLSRFRSTERSLPYRTLRWVERVSAGFAHYVIAANDIWRDKLVSRSVPENRCITILPSPDRSIFHREGRTRDDRKIIIMYPGTLSGHQGLDIAIRAFGLIRDIIPNAEFQIYGSGPEEESLERLTRELHLEDRIKFNGPRPLRDIPALMENADLGVVPKRDDTFGDEAFSTKTLEFMAMGVPVIVADTKIDRFYFDDSVVRFFRAGDAQSLADAMVMLIMKPAVRERLVRNATQFIEATDWDSKKDSYMGLLNHLVNGRN
jgi:glycosyltransferase involved in cell wall biosynthesis